MNPREVFNYTLGCVIGVLCIVALAWSIAALSKRKPPQAYTISLYQSGWLTRAYDADTVEQDGETLTFRDRKTGAAVTVCGGWVLETKIDKP